MHGKREIVVKVRYEDKYMQVELLNCSWHGLHGFKHQAQKIVNESLYKMPPGR